MNTPSTAELLIAEDGSQLHTLPDSIHIQEDSAAFAFLPTLDVESKYPREIVDVTDTAGREWTFTFICHEREAGGETLLEYRLNGLTDFLEDYNLKAGDTLIFRKKGRDNSIAYRRANGAIYNSSGTQKVLKLRGGWKTVSSVD